MQEDLLAFHLTAVFHLYQQQRAGDIKYWNDSIVPIRECNIHNPELSKVRATLVSIN